MPLTPILLIHPDHAPVEAVRAEAEPILATWPGGSPPPLRLATHAQVLETQATLKDAGIAWLWCDTNDPSALYELLDPIQEQHLPAALTQTDDDRAPGTVVFDGVVVCPATPIETCCALLAALHSQTTTLAAMNAELKLLRLHQAGVAGQIDKIDEELRLAAQLQREFMPTQLPQIDPLAFSVMWRPAGYVSGDIYDVERLDEDHVGMFIADAVGHGVPAALMTVYIKRSLDTKELDPDNERGYRIVDPGEALGRLNRDMVAQQSGKVRFATAAYVVLNQRTLIAKVARAGHPFPMLLRAGGKTEMLEPEGGLLGVFPEEVFEVAEVQLEPNDRLLLYSDGFELAFPEAGSENKNKIANEHYATEFEKLRHGSLCKGLAHLGELLDLQAGSLNQRDDLTVLGVSVSADAQVPADTTAAGAVTAR